MKMLSKLVVFIFAVSMMFAAVPENAQAMLFASDWSGNLFSVNTSNASLGLVGSTGLSLLGGLEFAPNGTLYGITAGNGSLYTINPNNAAATLVGGLGLGFNFEGGLAFSPGGVAYGVNEGSNGAPNLFTIDLNSGAATIVGQMGTGHDINGLAWRSDGMLVGIDDNTSSLVTIDPSTASIANLYDLGFSVGGIGGMTTDPLSGISYFATGITVNNNNVLGTNGLYSFDLYSGANSFLGNFNGSDQSGISGLAAVGTVPEPGTLGLIGLGLTGLTFWRRKRS